jgi:hypothetical protein
MKGRQDGTLVLAALCSAPSMLSADALTTHPGLACHAIHPQLVALGRASVHPFAFRSRKW